LLCASEHVPDDLVSFQFAEIENSASHASDKPKKSNEHWTGSKKFDIISKASVQEARSDLLNSLQRQD
jgi:hypothetical protein